MKVLLGMSGRGSTAPQFPQFTVVVVAAGGALFADHLEVLFWAFTYAAVGAASRGTDLIYCASGNYTMPGYSDVLPVEH